MKRLLVLCAALSAFWLPNLTAAEETLASGTAGSTAWELSSPLSILPGAGYTTVTLTASNPGNRATKASYKLTSSPAYYGGSNESMTIASGSLDLPAGKTASATHWLWLGAAFDPSYNTGYVSLAVSTPAGNSSDTIDRGQVTGSRVAITQNMYKAERSEFSFRGGRLVMNKNHQRGEVTFISLDSLPADWRIFSSMHALFITPDDWDEISPGVRDAMRLWLGFGGYIRVVAVEIGEASRVVNEIRPPGASLGVFANKYAVQAILFTQFRNEFIELSGAPATAFNTKIADSGTNLDPRRDRWDYERRNRRQQSFPLRDEFGRRDIPYSIICTLLVAFAIIVGPLSLYLWAPAGRRHRLFFTTPVFSLATSGLLLVIMLLQDGMGIDGRRFVLLDLAPAESSQPNAIVYQEQFSRAGMTGGGGFELAEGLLPLLPSEAWQESLTVSGSKATGSWFSSRRDRSMALAGAVPIRWKVTHERASEDSLTLRVESPITKFEAAWFVDEKGHVWQADRNGLDSDGNLTFIPASNDPEGVMEPMLTRCSETLRKTILPRMSQSNQRNRFWALVSDDKAASLAAQATHEKIDWLETNLVLTSKVTPK